MSQGDAWKVLSAGIRTEVVLTMDFDVTGRPQAGFSDLTANLKTDYSIWLSLPPEAPEGKDMDAAGYLDRWLAGPRSSGVEVKAVLGYCVGAVYAAEAAGRIARWQPEPPALVLLDPEPAVQLSLYSQFHNVLNLMGTLVPAERIAVAHQAGRLAHDGSGDMDTLAAELIKIFEGLSTEALSQAGLDEISRRELTGTFVAFMTYLTMAGRFDPFPAWREATALSSSSPGNGLNAIRAYSQGAVGPLVAKELRFATDHIDLLRSPDVAAAVSDLLNG